MSFVVTFRNRIREYITKRNERLVLGVPVCVSWRRKGLSSRKYKIYALLRLYRYTGKISAYDGIYAEIEALDNGKKQRIPADWLRPYRARVGG